MQRKILLPAAILLLTLHITGCSQNAETLTMSTPYPGTTKQEENVFHTAKTMEENIEALNAILMEKYDRQMTCVTAADYVKSEPAIWTLVIGDGRIGIDTATWKRDCAEGSDEEEYMNAVLTAFIFYYGEEMGNDLWLLIDDLLDGGADETLYGFTHSGSQLIYKNGNSAAFGEDEHGNFYLWLTPNGLGL